MNFDISNYTDNQLFDILELVQPTDRELEAKILYYVNKYKSIVEFAPTEINQRFLKFFEEMYDHFFMDEDFEEGFEDDTAAEEDELEGFQTNIASVGMTGAAAAGGATAATEGSTITAAPIYVNKPTDITVTKQVDYSKDQTGLNPILKQTVTTLMTIDSSYREDKYESSTSFSFNLSRPLRDVISMKLYSVQIPYTWWTINDYYGGNFFYLKGNVPGIDNGNHDYQVIINSGNYTGDSLTTAINDYITNTLPTLYTDISFAGTYLEYIKSNSKSAMHVCMKKQFVETDYEIQFSNVESSLQYNSLYNFLGFSNYTYDFNTLYSTSRIYSSRSNLSLYTIDSTNNYFYVIQYTSDYELYDSTTSTALLTHTISLGLSDGTYNESSLLIALNSAISSYSGFTNSYCNMITDTDTGTYYYKLHIQLNRKTNFNVAGAKVRVVFPAETSAYPVWTTAGGGVSRCAFNFSSRENELSNLVSTADPKPTLFYILNDMSFSLVCTTPMYVDDMNNYRVDVSSGTYIVQELVQAVNTGISNTNQNTYSKYNTTGIFNLTNTYCYLDNDTQKMKVRFDINKNFTQDMFYVDFSYSFFTDYLNFEKVVYDMSCVYSSSFPIYGGNYKVSDKYNKIYFYPKDGYGLSSRTPFFIDFSAGIYKTLDSFKSMITNSFVTFQDEYGDYIFSETTVGYTTSYNNSSGMAEGVMNLNIKLNKTLTEDDYKVIFYEDVDSSYNYWRDDFKFDSSYDLVDFGIEESSTGTYYSVVTGNTNIDVVYFTVDSSNDTISFFAKTDGVYSSGGENDIILSIPHGSYSQTQIFAKINALFDENSLLSGSSIYINNDGYTVIRVYIDKYYTAKDWRLVFFDQTSFIKCNNQSPFLNAVWDATLGWLMGFQTQMEYSLAETAGAEYTATNTYTYTSSTEEVSLGADTLLNTNRINYAIIVMNDYNQNILNNSLVTVVGGENTTPLPSYANYYRYGMGCINQGENGAVGLGENGALNKNPTTFNSLTQNQIYAIQQIQQTNIGLNELNYFTKGPNVKDIFAMVPIKVVGMSTGQLYTEFGGSLQNQKREYFGPVNIQRISITLLADNGQILDLNGCNWSFSVLVEQLYGTTTARTGAGGK